MNYLELSLLDAASFPSNSLVVALCIFTPTYIHVKESFFKIKQSCFFPVFHREAILGNVQM